MADRASCNSRLRHLLLLSAVSFCGFFLCVCLADEAAAHVKWFGAYEVAGQPRPLTQVICPQFELLVGLAIVVLLAARMIEGTRFGDAQSRALNRVTSLARENTEFLFRAGCAFFFVSLWATGGILLTPDLKTESLAIPYLQLAIAAGMMSRQTMPISALGIFLLFGLAVHRYGAFHLADYPIFLGVAAYLALTGLQRDLFGLRPLDVVRWAASITLMWASVEKWAYPDWSFPLLAEHPAIGLGLDPEFYMRLAGMVEFTLAFALLLTPLARRTAAILLLAMFISATFEFGKLDVIGHALIIVALLSIAADDVTETAPARHPLTAPVGFAAALGIFLSMYYLSHAALFGTLVL
jgi:hypothetical protein